METSQRLYIKKEGYTECNLIDESWWWRKGIKRRMGKVELKELK